MQENLSPIQAPAFRLGSIAGPTISSGTGSPEGVATAPVGSRYARIDGGTNTATYRKETGSGNTGWVADSAGAGGSAAVTTVEIDFGAVSVRNKVFTITDAA